MEIRSMFKQLAKQKLFLMFALMIIASFDGVIISQVISRLSTFNEKSSLADVGSLLFFGLGAYIIVHLSAMGVTFIKKNMINQLNQHYKMTIIQSLCKNKCKHDVGDTISLLTVDFKIVEDKYFSIIFDCMYFFLMGLVSLSYLVYLHPIIAVLFIICSFLPMLPSFIFEKRLTQATENYTVKNSGFIKNIKDLFQGYDEILTYHAFPTFFKKTQHVLTQLENSNEQLGGKHALVNFVATMLSWLSYLIPIGVALVFVTLGQISPAVVIALFLASDRVIYPFRNVSEYLRLIKSTRNTREKLATILVENFENQNVEMQVPVMQPIIQFEQVSFGFDEMLYTDVNVSIPYGSKVLITGVSGSGKTTLLDLVQRRLVPTKGVVKIADGGNILSGLHIVSRIQQEPYYFDMSLRENIVMGLSDVPDTAILSVLSEVGLLSELGEDCLDKRYGENGDLLSGGQKQRIEIVRALIHQKKIVLVDEGTSSVDKQASQQIRQLFKRIDATVLEVAHHYDEQMDDYYTHHLVVEDKKIICQALKS